MLIYEPPAHGALCCITLVARPKQRRCRTSLPPLHAKKRTLGTPVPRYSRLEHI